MQKLNFKQKVLKFVNKVPKGKVVSYGQVAAAIGSPRAARQVGWTLASLDGSGLKIPWWRVVNSKGYLSIRGNLQAEKQMQKAYLESEGVEVSAELVVDMEKYRYKFK